MDLLSIASGSSGNCIYVGDDEASILVDTGISLKRIEQGLNSIEHTARDISAILITHEHMDHVKGLGVISRKYEIPIYTTEATFDAIKKINALDEIDEELFCPIKPDEEFYIQNIKVEAHSIWHDAADPVCYSFMEDGKKISIATDFGDYNDYMVESLKDSDALLIESNHDIHMLEAGPYPYDLKRRILGKNGHLSNEAAGKLIGRLLNNHIKTIMLGHLSRENNFAELAYETVKLELSDNEYTDDVRDFNLNVLSRTTYGQLVSV